MPEAQEMWMNVRQDWRMGEGPSKASLSNAETLLTQLRAVDMLPDHASRGYWPTTVLHWGSPTIEIEVFDTDFELYVFPPMAPGPLFDVFTFDGTREADILRLVEKVRTLLG